MSALDRLLVVDLTRHLPGPYATLVLADFGATVVKIEDRAGDPVRALGPVAFDSLNAGKRSVGLDLKNPEGRDTLLRLVDKADVLVEGFRPGVLERLGAGFDACRARNRRIVYASIAGYGPSGPYRDRAGHDVNYQSFAGALPSAGAATPRFQLADMSGSLSAVVGILLALVARARTGEGQLVEASLFGAAAALQPFRLVPAARGEPAFAADTLAGSSRATASTPPRTGEPSRSVRWNRSSGRASARSSRAPTGLPATWIPS